MRKYDQNHQLKKIVCNQCKKEVACVNGILKDQFFSVNQAWGYFSEHDGETDYWDLCQDCYKKLVQSFQIEPDVSEAAELMGE